jgi:hypothetical protein
VNLFVEPQDLNRDSMDLWQKNNQYRPLAADNAKKMAASCDQW